MIINTYSDRNTINYRPTFIDAFILDRLKGRKVYWKNNKSAFVNFTYNGKRYRRTFKNWVLLQYGKVKITDRVKVSFIKYSNDYRLSNLSFKIYPPENSFVNTPIPPIPPVPLRKKNFIVPITERSDLDICLEYQKTEDSKCYTEMVRRYNSGLWKNAFRMLYRTISLNMGLEKEDCYSEAAIIMEQVMRNVNPAKITKNNWILATMLKTYCSGWVSNQFKTANSEKRKNLQNVVALELDYMCASEEDLEESLIQESFVAEMYEDLNDIEALVLKLLLKGQSRKEIKEKLGIASMSNFIEKFKTKFNNVNLQFSY